jgi:hypothetical protein
MELVADGTFSSGFLVLLAISKLQWLKNLYTSDDVKDQIYKLAKKGLTPSKIGTFALLALTL